MARNSKTTAPNRKSIDDEGMKRLKEELNLNLAASNKEVVEKCDVIVLAIKPQVMEKVIAEIRVKLEK